MSITLEWAIANMPLKSKRESTISPTEKMTTTEVISSIVKLSIDRQASAGNRLTNICSREFFAVWARRTG